MQINILEGRAGYVLMDRVSVTISYSFCCLTTETVKYTSFIENLASSKYSYVGKDRETNVIINNKCTFCMFRRRAALCAKCKQVCVSKLLSAKKET